MRTLYRALFQGSVVLHTVSIRTAQGNWITLLSTKNKDEAVRVYDMIEKDSDNPVSLGEYYFEGNFTRITKSRD